MMEVILGYSSAPLRGAESSYQPLWAETCRKARGIPRQWLVLLKMSEELSAGLSCENLWVALNLGTPAEVAWHEQLAVSWALGQGPRRQQEAGRCSHQAWKRRCCTTWALMAWWTHNPKARASLRIPHHPVPPGAGISDRWDRASMHYLQLHQPITLKQLHQHRGCWNALFCIDHNDTSQHYEPLRYFRPSTSEVTECQKAADIKFAFSIKDWGVEGVRKKKKNTLKTYLETAEKLCTNLTSHRESASSGWTGFKYLKSYTMNWVSFNLCVFFFEDLLNTEDFLQLSYCHRFSNLYTSLTRGGNLVPENLVL